MVQDSLCRALETWPVHGLPDNPSAWLMRVARNRAIDLVRRDDQFRYFAPELVHLLRLREHQPEETPAFEKEIQDDQLRMMFSCCHPELSTEAVPAPLLELVETTREPSGPTGRTLEKPHEFLKFGPVKV